jgi:chromosome segregation protein
MRLKKLILHGFKSFADRTEFLFDSPITGIVGPNGCGKSNVVDGFKWVLGEQSAKSLRGDAMMDVIFNGSGGRKPAGMAEVVLVFENPRRGDDTRLLNIDTDEVAVGRRLFRDGTSEYQINNQASRLKDIKELFLDTGVGVDAYSVIEQGRVAALLEANPAERRLIFEEAAGISKYKVKKKEAQRKLEKVDQNLLRVKDIVDEVEKRLRSVKIQAGRARTFQEYSTRLSELRLTYSIQEYHTQYQQSAELKGKLEDAQFRLDDLSQDLARKQNELAKSGSSTTTSRRSARSWSTSWCRPARKCNPRSSARNTPASSSSRSPNNSPPSSATAPRRRRSSKRSRSRSRRRPNCSNGSLTSWRPSSGTSRSGRNRSARASFS